MLKHSGTRRIALGNEEWILFLLSKSFENRVGKGLGRLLHFLLVLFSYHHLPLKEGSLKTQRAYGGLGTAAEGQTQRQGSIVGAIGLQETILETSRIFPDRLCNVVTAKGRQPIWGEQTSGS